MIKTIKKLFESNTQKQTRQAKELLRENLSLIPIDLVYLDDPIFSIEDDKRTLYYKKFFDIISDKEVMDRITYLINKQSLS